MGSREIRGKMGQKVPPGRKSSPFFEMGKIFPSISREKGSECRGILLILHCIRAESTSAAHTCGEACVNTPQHGSIEEEIRGRKGRFGENGEDGGGEIARREEGACSI